MNRRQAVFALSAIGAALLAAPVSRAQPARTMPVIGLLDAARRQEWWTAFRQELRKLGYVDGKTVAYEERFANGKFERLPALAQELVRLNVAVIVTSGRVASQAAKDATRTIPIIMTTGDDPARAGLVASLARPGGNLTGLTSISAEIQGKRFEVLREVIPGISRLAVLWHRDNPSSAVSMRELETAARSSTVAIQSLPVKTGDELAEAFGAMNRARAQAVFVIAGPSFHSDHRRLSELALKHRLPSMHTQPEYVDAGGLLSYGPSYVELFRRAALYVDKILRGAKPGELPIEQPTTFELVVNLKTAQALGVTIPKAILLRADRTIE